MPSSTSRRCSSCWAAHPTSVGASTRIRSIASMPPMAYGGPPNGAISDQFYHVFATAMRCVVQSLQIVSDTPHTFRRAAMGRGDRDDPHDRRRVRFDQLFTEMVGPARWAVT